MVSRTFASGELPPFVSFSSGAVPLTINPGGAWTDIPLALTIASELGWALSSDTHGLVYDEEFDSHTFGASSLTLKTGSPVLGRWTRNGNDTKPPGNGNWNQNKGNLNNLDKVHIHDTDADSVNRDALLDALQAGNRLVFEVDSDKAEEMQEKVCQLMADAVNLDVELLAEAGIGYNWEHAH